MRAGPPLGSGDDGAVEPPPPRRGEARSRTTRLRFSAAIDVDGLERSYLFFASPAADPATSLAVDLVFPGGGGDTTSATRLTGFRTPAAREGFLVALPNAVGGHWNAGSDGALAESMREGAGDVAFTDAILADVARGHAIDPARVYGTGTSNGAIFVHRLASERGRTDRGHRAGGGRPRQRRRLLCELPPRAVHVLRRERRPLDRSARRESDLRGPRQDADRSR